MGRRIAQLGLLAFGEFDLQGGCNGQGDFVLDPENILKFPIIAGRPQMGLGFCICQLRGNANAIAGFAQAARHHEARV